MPPNEAPETEQEAFWRGEFGAEYARRNADESIVRSNFAFFARALRAAPDVGSIVELGCNIGVNLRALKMVDPAVRLAAYEINAASAETARALGVADVRCRSILEPDLAADGRFDLAFTKGVLIHIHPDQLAKVYRNLFELSTRYILVAEYYNPTPVMVDYRGHSDRLFKRDFAGELIDRFDLKLVDYGFVYHRDRYFPMDDVNWFLLERR
jgi:pseudaminic acid biosynthesis-associated methylase